jgi:hypothetical protein
VRLDDFLSKFKDENGNLRPGDTEVVVHHIIDGREGIGPQWKVNYVYFNEEKNKFCICSGHLLSGPFDTSEIRESGERK